MEYELQDFLIMHAYYKDNTEDGVFNLLSNIKNIPKVRIILYNFEKQVVLNLKYL